jgi:protocatechuate 3,4-dioxygenase, alpha subunit
VSRAPERLWCLPSQTVGPFFHLGLIANTALGCLAGPAAKGDRIRLRFRLFDGDGLPVPDGIIELWQADASGKYNHPADTQERKPDPAFCGFGRLATGADGACSFDTIRPGRVPDGQGGFQASHISVSVFARGLLGRLCTRAYFDRDPALAEDAVLMRVPKDRRQTLIAQPDPASPGSWLFDIHLQGERETVFFDI